MTRDPEEYIFLESGTWTIPEGATWMRVEARGGDMASDNATSGDGWVRVTVFFGKRPEPGAAS